MNISSVVSNPLVIRFRYLIYLLFLPLISSLYGQTVLENKIYSPDVKSAQLYKVGWPLSQPFLKLGGTDQLLLSFDDLTGSAESYSYTVVHCNSDWEESGLNPVEYIDGFSVNPILNYKYSFSTTYRYVHYELLLPNRDLNFKISGNYVVKVTKEGDVLPSLIKRFYVVDNKVSIKATVKPPINSLYRDTHQDLKFSIYYPNLKISNPHSDISVFIRQNGREDSEVRHLKAQYIRPDELVYDYFTETLFEGLNEFRWLDIRSFRFQSERTAAVGYYDPFYHVDVVPDYTRNEVVYFFRQDYNGKYILNVKEGRDPALEADYAFAHLFVPLDAPFVNSSLHLFGDAFGWNASDENQFQYNFDTHRYEFTTLLKQGLYDYMIGVKEQGKEVLDFSRFEGNNRFAENDYTIFVYYKAVTDNYEQLIGLEIVNSLRK